MASRDHLQMPVAMSVARQGQQPPEEAGGSFSGGQAQGGHVPSVPCRTHPKCCLCIPRTSFPQKSASKNWEVVLSREADFSA